MSIFLHKSNRKAAWKIFKPSLGDTLSHCPHCTENDRITIAKNIPKSDQRWYTHYYYLILYFLSTKKKTSETVWCVGKREHKYHTNIMDIFFHLTLLSEEMIFYTYAENHCYCPNKIYIYSNR